MTGYSTKLCCFLLLLDLSVLMIPGCSWSDSVPDDERTRKADEQVQAKWGRSFADLPTISLVVISPHSETIRKEYEWAFSLHHAVQYGQKVRFDWRDVGGGSSTIRSYLGNVYERAQSCGIDVLWGGGELNFIPLAEDGILEPLKLEPEVLKNIPAELAGIPMYDAQLRWIGAAVSSFGFIYNAGLLGRCGIEPPGKWEELGEPRFADLVALADPTQSGSAAAAYHMIARSGKDWPDGWSRLLRILANAKRFTDSAGEAANAPALGEALVATCIDFYGTIRVAEAPEELAYISPHGQTIFTPDPIGILKNPPHPELAQRFIDFVMSIEGQALWSLRVGEQDGPVRSPLGRQPIRRDVYEKYGQNMLASISSPYQAGQAMKLEWFRQQIDFGVLRQLVRAAAIDNLAGLRKARAKLIETNFEPQLLAEFNRLPSNVATVEDMAKIKTQLEDQTKRELIVTDWQRFFREKYCVIVERSQ